MKKVLIFSLLAAGNLFSQCLFATSKPEGNTVIFYGECFHKNVIPNVFLIDEDQSTILVKTGQGKEYRYFKINITGYEILKSPADTTSAGTILVTP